MECRPIALKKAGCHPTGGWGSEAGESGFRWGLFGGNVVGSGTYEHLQAKEQAERVQEEVARYVTGTEVEIIIERMLNIRQTVVR